MSGRKRPVFLNLVRIQMPVGALTSIAHRLSGVALALGVPWLIYILDLSLRSPQSYEEAVGLLRHPAARAALIVLAWALAHHLLAGVRHLLSDVDVGSRLIESRRSALFVNLAGVAIALLAAGIWL